jgi:hypothetical protein
LYKRSSAFSQNRFYSEENGDYISSSQINIQHPQGKEEKEETKEKETHEIITAQQQYHLKTSDVHFDRN